MPKQESFVDTPDGVGNVSGVDLLRETVQVRLDSAPESPKRYRRCEIRVLRNGKGSREGIEIPKERPERAPAREREESWPGRQAIPIPSVLLDETEDEEERRERRPNSRRSGGKGAKQGKRQQARPEKRPERPQPVRPSADVTAEKKAAADRAAARQDGKPNYRKSFRRPRGKGGSN